MGVQTSLRHSVLFSISPISSLIQAPVIPSQITVVTSWLIFLSVLILQQSLLHILAATVIFLKCNHVSSLLRTLCGVPPCENVSAIWSTCYNKAPFFFWRKINPELTSAANSPLIAEEDWPWANICAHLPLPYMWDTCHSMACWVVPCLHPGSERANPRLSKWNVGT